MKIKLTGKHIKTFDYNIDEIEIDINDLYRELKKLGYYLLSPNDTRNPFYYEKIERNNE